MLLRVWRISTAASPVPSTKAGMIMRCRLPDRILPERHEARRGQPAEPHREEQDQHDPEPEARDRQRRTATRRWRADPRPCCGAPPRSTPAGIAMPTAISSESHASSIVIGSFLRHRLGPRARACGSTRRDRRAAPARSSAGTGGRSGSLEAVLLADLLEPGGVGVGAAHHARGVAGDHAHAGEHDQADHEQGHDRDRGPLDQELEHRPTGRRRAPPQARPGLSSRTCP